MVVNINALVTGSSGQLGTQFKKIKKKINGFNFLFFDKKQLDISNNFLLIEKIREFRIDYIINCAAYTDVDKSESNKRVAEKVNSISVENMAKICYEENIGLIHISSDYVFDGNNKLKYLEDDLTNPINFYGITKLKGEKGILKYNPKKSLIIRTSWLYSELKNNFVSAIVKKIINQEDIYVVNDEFGCPTNSMDLAKTILEIIPKLTNNNTEIYHYCNDGICSRYEFAKEIAFILNAKSKIIPVDHNISKIDRPKNSALNTDKIRNKFNIEIRSWQESLNHHFNSN